MKDKVKQKLWIDIPVPLMSSRVKGDNASAGGTKLNSDGGWWAVPVGLVCVRLNYNRIARAAL